ncbi:unnamed protein product, partial [Prorocentrum cordatum]
PQGRPPGADAAALAGAGGPRRAAGRPGSRVFHGSRRAGEVEAHGPGRHPATLGVRGHHLCISGPVGAAAVQPRERRGLSSPAGRRGRAAARRAAGPPAEQAEAPAGHAACPCSAPRHRAGALRREEEGDAPAWCPRRRQGRRPGLAGAGEARDADVDVGPAAVRRHRRGLGPRPARRRVARPGRRRRRAAARGARHGRRLRARRGHGGRGARGRAV